MKYLLILFIVGLCCISCNKPPYSAPAEPERVWVDEETRSDTIITSLNGIGIYLYYAEKNWQSSADTDLTHGYRQIAIRFHEDSIFVKPLNDTSFNYAGPFLLKINSDKTILNAQNFIDTSYSAPTRIFVLR